MLGIQIRTNIKTIIRDPTTLLALFAAFIVFMTSYLPVYVDPDETVFTGELAWQNIVVAAANITELHIKTVLPTFSGVIVAVNLFRDKKNGTFDIIAAGQTKYVTYYLGKLISYYIIIAAVCFSFTVLHNVYYLIFMIPKDPNFSLIKVYLFELAAIMIYYSSTLFVPLAWAVFLSSVTGVGAVGAVFGAAYSYIGYLVPNMYDTFLGYYIHSIPAMLTFNVRRMGMNGETGLSVYSPEQMTRMGIAAYASQIVIAAVLFFASYFILKRRYTEK